MEKYLRRRFHLYLHSLFLTRRTPLVINKAKTLKWYSSYLQSLPVFISALRLASLYFRKCQIPTKLLPPFLYICTLLYYFPDLKFLYTSLSELIKMSRFFLFPSDLKLVPFDFYSFATMQLCKKLSNSCTQKLKEWNIKFNNMHREII